MVILFIHQNFPGQFRHVAEWLGAHSPHQVIGLGDQKNTQRYSAPQGVTLLGYASPEGAGDATHHYLRDHEAQVRRGQQVVRAVQQLINQGITPDITVTHPAWGEALFLKTLLPKAHHIQYCEFYYQNQGADIDFDPEYPSSIDGHYRSLCRNATQLLSLTQADACISPTQWQCSRYPIEYQHKIKVVHEGVNTQQLCPNENAYFEWQGQHYDQSQPIVTYVARNLEPYRGFHTFMRCLPALQAQHPKAHIFIVGGDEVSYGKHLPDQQTYRDYYQNELGDAVDWHQVHFTGKLPYADYLRLLQISTVHTYLTYPFVLSWSLIEAMSVGCTIVASRTAPVEEVIQSGRNGLLVDFFDSQALADQITQVLNNPSDFAHLGQAARQTAIERFDLETMTLPQWINLITAGPHVE